MTTSPLLPGYHRCPKRGCPKVVSDELFACRPDWYSIPADIRSDIWATAYLPLTNPTRSEVVLRALAALNPPASTP